MFTSDDIQERVKQQPFTPMRIITSSGHHYDVYHPDLIMVGRRQVVIGFASKENPLQFDQLTQVGVLHVAAIENLSIPASPQKNGQLST